MEISTESGVVRGLRGRHVARWRAIPYAAPPVGDLRLRAPEPVEPWTGVRDATAFANAAIQSSFGVRIGPRTVQPMSEDALTLNITAPAAEATAPRPVIVFIHGGAYLFGTSALALYSGSRLAVLGDVIFVSLNYRLGALGYVDFSEFSTPQRRFDSNLGLRDQVAALQWVQRNIAAFGGDPNNVTVMGESAGGNAVTTLLATPAAEGLFHRAIAESSPADWAISADDAGYFARRCVAAMGASHDTAAQALSTMDAHELRRAVAREMRAVARDRAGLLVATPVVDGDFLPERPLDAMAARRAHRVPLLIGTNHDEGTLFAKHLDELPTNQPRLETLFEIAGPGYRDKVLAAYPDYPNRATMVRMGGDYIFWRPTIQACENHGRHVPTFTYRYDYAPPLLRLAGYGATHAAEMLAVFGFGDTPGGRLLTVGGGRRDLRAVTRFVQTNWLHFARHGRPNDDWPAYTTAHRSTQIIDVRPRIVHDPDRHRRLAWAGFPSATLGAEAIGEIGAP